MRELNLLGAPTNLGNRPYEDTGAGRLTSLGPARLRDRGVTERLRAHDLGDVAAPPYRDFVRPPGGIRNEDLIAQHTERIAARLRGSDRRFTLILGGDCSVLLGALPGLFHDRSPALVYIDAHTDFGTPATSETGGAAGMDLALATGRGDSRLARPLLRDADIIAAGVRAGTFGDASIARLETAEDILEHLDGREFFIHVDADVLDPQFMPFVDSPEPGGLHPDALIELLRPLVLHPLAAGMELTIYDPRDDHDHRGAELLVSILESTLHPP